MLVNEYILAVLGQVGVCVFLQVGSVIHCKYPIYGQFRININYGRKGSTWRESMQARGEFYT